MQNSYIINYKNGLSIDLIRLQKSGLKGVSVDDIARFAFYRADLQNGSVIVVEPRQGVEITPHHCRKMSMRLSQVLGFPIVFKFDKQAYYERMRLLQKGVYFITSDGNIHLPNVILTARSPKKIARKLSSSAQYLILHHLQKASLEGKSISEISEQVPYSYVSVAKAVEVLEDLHLCECIKDGGRNKRIHFPNYGREYWNKVNKYFVSPVIRVYYCDEIPDIECPESGISALSEYSNLAEDGQRTVAVYESDFRNMRPEGLNDFDGPIELEVWKYPPVAVHNGFVDKLSLYLSLRGNEDPRVEKENEYMLENVWEKVE